MKKTIEITTLIQVRCSVIIIIKKDTDNFYYWYSKIPYNVTIQVDM